VVSFSRKMSDKTREQDETGVRKSRGMGVRQERQEETPVQKWEQKNYEVPGNNNIVTYTLGQKGRFKTAGKGQRRPKGEKIDKTR